MKRYFVKTFLISEASLVTNYGEGRWGGGLQKGRGWGQVKFYPFNKVGRAEAEGHNNFLGNFNEGA